MEYNLVTKAINNQILFFVIQYLFQYLKSLLFFQTQTYFGMKISTITITTKNKNP
jgi:hypothetical protein